jgi:hypothetical protein
LPEAIITINLLTVNRKTSNLSLRLLVYRMYKTMMLSMGSFLIGSMLGLSCLSTGIFKQQEQALAQQYIQTIKYRSLVIDLGNGVKTNAQLTYPALGKDHSPESYLSMDLVHLIRMKPWD